MGQCYDYLSENGPATSDDLPGDLTTGDRKKGVWSLKIRIRSSGSSRRTFGPLKCIYYIRDEHQLTDVVRKWMDVNDGYVDDREVKHVKCLMNRQGSEFGEAFEAVIERAAST